uniref:Hyaluronate lyase n=1 Tax=Siphoviridae sp. ctICF6 TaxID=2825427 RepID=A0A8S5ULA7_9CAUD|nr:MAG TPA: hyaluronate lyase [Siphoviridae sp. ctICF6]
MMSTLANCPSRRAPKFDIKILKSTGATTSGGDNTWSAAGYASTLNMPASHDFGEFTDNLIPNGNFDEGQVKWTPADAITKNSVANSNPNVVTLQKSASATSDVFVIPPNQTLRLTGYCMGWNVGKSGTVLIQIVSPQQEVLSESKLVIDSYAAWDSFSKTFTTGGTSLECSVKLTNNDSPAALLFDSLSLVST